MGTLNSPPYVFLAGEHEGDSRGDSEGGRGAILWLTRVVADRLTHFVDRKEQLVPPTEPGVSEFTWW